MKTMREKKEGQMGRERERERKRERERWKRFRWRKLDEEGRRKSDGETRVSKLNKK